MMHHGGDGPTTVSGARHDTTDTRTFTGKICPVEILNNFLWGRLTGGLGFPGIKTS